MLDGKNTRKGAKNIDYINFSQAAENNKNAILQQLRLNLRANDIVLEIGSGSGQHAVYFSSQMPHITWLSSDQGEYLPGLVTNIEAGIKDAQLQNLVMPCELNLDAPSWPDNFSCLYSANVIHIMPEKLLPQVFTSKADTLLLYGPYKYRGEFTSESNARFDEWLKERNPLSGVRDIEALQMFAEQAGYKLTSDTKMPANNQFLVFSR